MWDQEDGESLAMQLGDTIRVRVKKVFFPTKPTAVLLHEARLSGKEDAVGQIGNPYMPMRVVADCSMEGLGGTSWWSDMDEGEEEVEDLKSEEEVEDILDPIPHTNTSTQVEQLLKQEGKNRQDVLKELLKR